MTPTKLIVVTDRGSLKAYKVSETPNRGAALTMVQSFETTDAHGRFQDKLTDQAGRFASGEGGGGATAERQGIVSENDRRIIRQLADNIAELVQREGMDGWSFAAPASIHSAIFEKLPQDICACLVEHVKSDLVKLDVAALPSHFRSLQPL